MNHNIYYSSIFLSLILAIIKSFYIHVMFGVGIVILIGFLIDSLFLSHDYPIFEQNETQEEEEEEEYIFVV